MALDIDTTILAKIAAGMLSTAAKTPEKMTFGSATPCDGCDELILSTDMEYGVAGPDGHLLRLHRQCHWAWFDAWVASRRTS